MCVTFRWFDSKPNHASSSGTIEISNNIVHFAAGETSRRTRMAKTSAFLFKKSLASQRKF